jgi:hypothetical protein
MTKHRMFFNKLDPFKALRFTREAQENFAYD